MSILSHKKKSCYTNAPLLITWTIMTSTSIHVYNPWLLCNTRKLLLPWAWQDTGFTDYPHTTRALLLALSFSVNEKCYDCVKGNRMHDDGWERNDLGNVINLWSRYEYSYCTLMNIYRWLMYIHNAVKDSECHDIPDEC